jgi:hypothetical protein
VGSIEGQFASVFVRLAKLQAKNAFAFAIVTGDLFADPFSATEEDEAELTSLLDEKVAVPLPTYFGVGRHSLPPIVVDRLEAANGEVCENLFFVGKRSTTKTSEGIRIVALGGAPSPGLVAGVSKEKYLPFHTESDAKALYGANSADILLTSSWPLSIQTGSQVALPKGVAEPVSEQCVADLCATLKPRYHFSTTADAFYEREPFFHQPTENQPGAFPITRFISLASYTSPSKAKWMYAFNLDPKSSPPLVAPPGATASPLSHKPKKRPLPDQDDSYGRFSKREYHNHRNSKRKQPPPGPAECFFCLSNPNLATHLITSIASDTYLTIARGPLSTASTFKSLPFPAHILIIPLSHSPTLGYIPEQETRATTYAEMLRYRTALQAMVAEKSNGELGAVTWEVSRAGGVHVHWQFMPVPVGLTKRGLVEAAFKVEAENEKYPPLKSKNIGDGSSEDGDYFRVWIWRPGQPEDSTGIPPAESENAEAKSAQMEIVETSSDAKQGGQRDGEVKLGAEREKLLVLPISSSFRFDLQFGRKVMAKLLGLETRFQWQDCAQAEEAEAADADAFKTAFKPFDFSLEE